MAATALEGCSSSSPLPTLPLCLGVFFGLLLLHGSPQPVMGFRPVTELGAGWCLTICDDDFCLEGRQTSAPAEDMMAIPEWPVLCTACWCFSILLKLLASREAAGTLPPATHIMWAQAVAALQYYTHTHTHDSRLPVGSGAPSRYFFRSKARNVGRSQHPPLEEKDPLLLDENLCASSYFRYGKIMKQPGFWIPRCAFCASGSTLTFCPPSEYMESKCMDSLPEL